MATKQAAKRVMSRPPLTARKMNAEEADPARVMAIATALVDGIG
jgi:hypothetical protein